MGAAIRALPGTRAADVAVVDIAHHLAGPATSCMRPCVTLQPDTQPSTAPALSRDLVNDQVAQDGSTDGRGPQSPEISSFLTDRRLPGSGTGSFLTIHLSRANGEAP